MTATSGVELVAVAFAALAPDEQEQAFARINDVRLTRVAAGEGETAAFIRSLRRVADAAGGELTSEVYRRGANLALLACPLTLLFGAPGC